MGKCIYMRKGSVHTKPVAEVEVGALAIGSIVNINEGDSLVEFIVVHQGLPGDTYDSSCNGTWLLRNKCLATQYKFGSNNNYSASTINTWLNGDYFNTLGNIEQGAIRSIKIPYWNGTGSSGSAATGANGLSTKIFLLSGSEVGYTVDDKDRMAIFGEKLSYFYLGTDTTANKQRKTFSDDRIGANWWLRSPRTGNTGDAWYIDSNGNAIYSSASVPCHIRPAFVIPSGTLIHKSTRILIEEV